jgi:predicted anti-sigma-YlaC factor YlaD
MRGADLPCRDAIELATDYLEGALAASVRARLLEHLEVCPHCGRFTQQLAATVRMLSLLPTFEPDEPVVPPYAVDVFRAWRRVPPA